MTPLQMGTAVMVDRGDKLIRGKVIGKATDSISETYIIECIDGQLPNDVYPYNAFVAQLWSVTALDE